MSNDKSPYESKIWLKSYDEHVKPTFEISNLTIVDLLKNAVNEFPESLCYDFQGACANFQETENMVKKFANFLVESGVKKGDRVAINIPNCPQYIIALFGTFYAGCTLSGFNFLLSPKEIIYQLKDCGAVAFVTLDSFYEEKVREALQSGETEVRIVITTNISDLIDMDPEMKEQLIKMGKIPIGNVVPLDGISYSTFKEILSKYPDDKTPDIKIDSEKDIALLQYTGGTTGPSKGAILTHKNLIANLEHIYNWFEPAAVKGEHVYISGFPFFHLAGLGFCLQSVYNVAGQILVPDPRDTNYIADKMKRYQGRVILMYNVPTLYLMLLKNRRFRKLDFSAIEGYVSGAAPFASENIKEFENLVGEGKVLEGYGMTEASPGATMNPYLGPKKIGTVGLPIPNTELKIVDVADKDKEVPLGQPGEIVIRGPQIFQGYWNKPEETKNALKEGWFYSGDVGVMDEDGYIKIVDRTKDMIIVSGYKVFSVEVDDKLSDHPAIEMCSTIGVPDPNRSGSEIVKLFCLLKDGYENNEETKESILNFAKENLASYKVPKIIEIANAIPLTVIGKIDKKVLRAREREKASK